MKNRIKREIFCRSLFPGDEGEFTANVKEDTGSPIEMLKALSGYFDGNIIILYHPFCEMDISRGVETREATRAFREACEAEGIIFLDLSEVFEEAYSEEYVVPYGFWNTTMGEGHMNEQGHRLAAQMLYHELTKGREGVWAGWKRSASGSS